MFWIDRIMITNIFTILQLPHIVFVDALQFLHSLLVFSFLLSSLKQPKQNSTSSGLFRFFCLRIMQIIIAKTIIERKNKNKNYLSLFIFFLFSSSLPVCFKNFESHLLILFLFSFFSCFNLFPHSLATEKVAFPLPLSPSHVPPCTLPPSSSPLLEPPKHASSSPLPPLSPSPSPPPENKLFLAQNIKQNH